MGICYIIIKLPETRMCSFGVPVNTKGRSQNHKTFSTRPVVPKHVALNEQLMHNDNGTKCKSYTRGTQQQLNALWKSHTVALGRKARFVNCSLKL